MGTGRGPIQALARPHTAGLEGGARLISAVAGTLLIGAGLLHVSAAGDHTNLPVMMVGFLAIATLQAGLGGLLLFRRPGRMILAGGAALTVGALGTWLVSRTAGLPFLEGGHMEPIGFKDGVTVLFEATTVPLLALLVSSELDRVRLPSPQLGSQAVALAGAGVFALFVPALTLGGGEHHSAGEMAAHHGDAPGSDDDGHGHGTEELAQAAGSHLHDGDSKSGHAAGEHGAGRGGHEHGRAATPELFSKELARHGDHAGAAGHGSRGEADANGGGGGHEHAGGDQGAGGPDHEGSHDDGAGRGDGGDHGHGRGDGDGGGHEKGGDHGDGHDAGDEHGSGGHGEAAPAGNERSLALESGHREGEGRRARGPAVVFHDQPNEELNGRGHAHAGACEPTAAQRAAADALVSEVRAELRQYENNPAAALADGFNYVFGPTDRMLHVVHTGRMSDPDVLKASEIESFIYYMTDTGYVPIGGMFIMPEYGMRGPEPGGCLTQWHHHGGAIGRLATAGTRENTPEMMHVFTYPGLDPWGHYTGRDLAPLWTPGAWVPSICRSSADANSGCLP